VADKTWKAVERKVSALFGTTRIPPSVFGQRSDRGSHAPDAETDLLSIQIKHSYNFPGYLADWLDGIRKTTPAGKTGGVVWHPKGAPVTGSLVLLTAEAFAAIVQRASANSAGCSCAQPGSRDDTPS
jgi:hypothetical protein